MVARRPQKEMAKEEVFSRVFRAAMSLDFRKGHQRWTLSEVSRISGVTRTLIYYYFGRSREDLLLEAVKSLGTEFFGLSPERLNLWRAGKVGESINKSRQFMQEHPDLAAFYILHRNRPTSIGEAFRDLERKHFQKLKQHFPHSTESENRARKAMIIGLALASGLNSEDVEAASATLSKS